MEILGIRIGPQESVRSGMPRSHRRVKPYFERKMPGEIYGYGNEKHFILKRAGYLIAVAALAGVGIGWAASETGPGMAVRDVTYHSLRNTLNFASDVVARIEHRVNIGADMAFSKDEARLHVEPAATPDSSFRSVTLSQISESQARDMEAYARMMDNERAALLASGVSDSDFQEPSK